VNLLGSVATARAFLPALAASRGYYLQVASLAAMAPAPLMAAYCASKAGAESFARALRAEVARLAPELVATAAGRRLLGPGGLAAETRRGEPGP
jgi:short-subunit dehydrogenase